MNFLNPKNVISQSLIFEGSYVADFGFGTGSFLQPLLEKVGKEGVVYAFDIQPDIVKKVSEEFSQQGIDNIKFSIANLQEKGATLLAENSLDFVLLSSLLFQNEDKSSVLQEAVRVLRPTGRLLIIDWKESFAGIGPEKKHIVGEGEVAQLLRDLPVELEKQIDGGDYHYCFLYRKK